MPVPREAIVADRSEGAALRDTFAPPLIVKPPRSFTLEDLEARRRVARAENWHEVDLLLDEMLVDGPVAVQDLVRGTGMGVEMLLGDGVPLLAFQHVRLHEPLHGGASSYRRSVPVSEKLLGFATRLLGELRYTGVAMVEFKQDAETGRSVLLEVNARFWGSLPLALAAGADFPLALFELLVEGRTKFDGRYRVGLCARNLTDDAWWHVQNLRADRSDPTLNSRPWPRVARRDVPEPPHRARALRRPHGRRPGAGLRRGQAPGLRPRPDRPAARALRACPGQPPRAGGDSGTAARAELEGAARVLFVCAGNIGRSPFAAALAERSLRNGQEIRSAGFARPGRRSPAEAVAAAAGWQVDLSGHRSQVVSGAVVRESDAIFVFDYRNYSDMVRRFPEAWDRVLPFGALDPGGPLFLPDPWGRGAEAYDATYRRIAEALGVS